MTQLEKAKKVGKLLLELDEAGDCECAGIKRIDPDGGRCVRCRVKEALGNLPQDYYNAYYEWLNEQEKA
jgi:hypothetical protein